MKKFLLSLAGVALALSASADRYWIHGQIFGDSSWGSVELTLNEATGKYEKVGKLVKGEFGVKVTPDGSEEQKAWYSAPNSPATAKEVSAAGTYKIQSSQNTNFTSTLEGNYTISLDWAAKELKFEPYSGDISEGPSSYQLRGNCFDSSDWVNKDMTESNGVWTWTGTIKAGEMGIQRVADGIKKAWYYAPTNRPGIISDKGTYLVVAEEGNNGKNLKTTVSGEATFTFNPISLELKVEGNFSESEDPETINYYFVGERTGWTAKPAYKLTAGENGDYYLDLNITMDPNKPFKFNDGNFDDDLEWGANADGDKVNVNQLYTMGGKFSGDLYVSEEIVNPHIVFNPEKSTLLITSRGGEVIEEPEEFPELYLVGSFSNPKWELGVEKYKFTRNENTYTLQYTGTFNASAEFKVADDDWDDGIDFGSNATNDKVVPGTAYTTVKHAGVEGNDHNLQLSASLKDPKFVFNISDNTLTVTGEEISEPVDPIEPTAYSYYIHGDIFNDDSADWTSVKLTAKDGKYVLSETQVEAGQFGIRVVDPSNTTDNPQVAWYAAPKPADADETVKSVDVTLGTAMTIADSNTLNFSIPRGKYTFTLDLEAMTLTVAGQVLPDVEHELSYRMRGVLDAADVESGDAWKDYNMTKNEDDTWSITMEKPLAVFGVKAYCSAHNKQYEWYASKDAENPAANEAGEYQAKAQGTNWTSSLTGKVTYTFDPENLMLTIATEGGDDPIPPVGDGLEYYIHGNCFGSWKSELMTADGNGNYVLADVTVNPGEFGVKVVDPDKEVDPTDPYDSTQIEWLAAASDMTVVIGETINLVNTDTKNIKINAGTYTFTFNPEHKTLVVTGEEGEEKDPVYVYSLKGATTDPNDWKVYAMENVEGKWTVTLETALSAFGIMEGDSANGIEQTSWINSADENPAANADGTYAAKVNGTNWTSTLTGKTTYTFDPEDMTLTIANEGGDGPVPPVNDGLEYYIHGNCFGSWKSELMTADGNGNYVLADVTVNPGEFGVKVVDPDKEVDPTDPYDSTQIEWLAAASDMTVVIGETINLVNTDTKNIKINAGTYTFTFNPEHKTLVVTGEEGEEKDPVYVYSLKGATTDPNDWKVYAMENVEGKWTVTLETALSAFGIMEGDSANGIEQTSWINSADENPAANANGTYAAKVNGTNWTSTITGKATYIFDPEAMTLTITGTTGISAIEAEEGEAIYFNLQGQRVANPDKGIYIRVLNGKAAKVVK